MKALIGWLLGPIILVGCAAQPTPLPAVVDPTATIEVASTLAAPTRYGIADHTLPYISDINVLRENALVEAMPPNPDLTQYDIAAGYGIYDGWQQAETMHEIVLVMNQNLPPVNDATIRNIVISSFDSNTVNTSIDIPGIIPENLTAIHSAVRRTELANAGYPDGFELTLAIVPVPGREIIIQQLNATNIDLNIIEADNDSALNLLQSNRVHLVLLPLTNADIARIWTESVGADNIIKLYSLPISYVNRDGIPLSFTDDGWPVNIRP